MLLDFVERGADVAGLVSHNLQRDVARQHLAAPIEPLLDGADHLDRIRPRLALDLQHHRRLPVVARQTADFLRGVDGFSQIAESDGRALDGRHHQVREGVRIGETSQRAEIQLASPRIDPPAGNLRVLALQRFADLDDRQAVGRQPPRLDLDLHGTVRCAGNRHLADPARRLDDVLDIPIRHHVKFAAVPLAGNCQTHHRRGIHVLLADHRRIGARRQEIEHAVDRVAHVLRGDVDVPVDLERQDQRRRPVAGNGPQLIDAFHRGDGVFEALRDLRLDLLGGRSPVRGAHVDAGQVHPRKTIHAQLQIGCRPSDDHGRDQHHREHGPLHTDFSQPLHAVRLP